MIVVDATVLADRVAGARILRDQAEALAELDPVWVAPILWRFELGNVLWRKVRFEGLQEEDAILLFEDVDFMLEESVSTLEWTEVFRLARRCEISCRDASYVWLAQSRGLPLYSRDERLRRNCPEMVRAMPAG